MNSKALAPRRSRLGALLPVVWIVVTGVVAVLPVLGLAPFWTRQLLLIAIAALLVSGLNLSMGWAGELNFGLPAMYAAGAYVTAYVATRVLNDLLVCLVLAALAAIVVGLIAGAPGLRVGGWMLAVCTFMLVTLIPVTLQIIPFEILGAQSGFTGIPRPEILGVPLDRFGFFAVAIIVTSLWFAAYRNAVRSQFGNSLLVLQAGSVLAPSLGLSPYRLKLVTYAFASIPIGIAGALFAYNDRFVAPEALGIHLIMFTLVASIVAGRRSVYAIVLGVIFIQFVNSFSTRFGEFGDVAFGIFLIVGGLVFGGGVAGLGNKAIQRVKRRRPACLGGRRSAGSNRGSPAGGQGAHVGVRLQVLRWDEGPPRRFAGRSARADHRAHRAERLRQDDHPEHHQRVPARHEWAGAARRRGCHRPVRGRDRPCRGRSHLPDTRHPDRDVRRGRGRLEQDLRPQRLACFRRSCDCRAIGAR